MSGNIFKRGNFFQKLRTQYRIVFINDESLQEVSTFRLSLRKLYVLLSTLFVLIVTLTVCVLLLTPLKYYIPGYGNNNAQLQVIRMKKHVDSLSDLVAAQQQYEENLRKVINGSYDGIRDTTRLNMNQAKKEAVNFIKPTEIRKAASRDTTTQQSSTQ